MIDKIKNKLNLLVDSMNEQNTYPYGKTPEKIAKKIISSKHLTTNEKIDLVLKTYGNFFKIQLYRYVSFDVYESYYENFMINHDGKDIKNELLFQKYYAKLEAMAKYIKLRELKKFFERLNITDNYENDIINKILNLQDNYYENQINNIYQLTDNEKNIIEKLENKSTKTNCEDIFQF